jgi:KUP system potassium uptake protein
VSKRLGGRTPLSGSLTLAALGIVFGDIGTSPLYAVREAFHGAHGLLATSENILGVLSLILWSLIVVISLKYLLFVMRADNRGEGGVLALAALAAPPRFVSKHLWSRILLYCGLFGSALLFGDGVITPAITVLGAIEGLEVATPFFSQFVIPITLVILIFLFFQQRHGTAKIGAIFGPVILVWFLTLAVLGICGIIDNPFVLAALNPLYAFYFFELRGTDGFLVLGAVFLVVTGGEALYADMGHFGRSPIQRGWFFVALPGLVLNYFGQGALLLKNPSAAINPFYQLAPSWALYPLVILATAAAVIASQALISGVFSLVRQAIQLGYSPRIRIIHTSSEEIGQIYIPQINWVLLVMTCWIVIEFGSSTALASAYGIAVSTTMVITTILACSVAYQWWRWSWTKTAAVLLIFLSIDVVFLTANFSKITDGGWVPLVMGVVVYTMMTTWRRGRQILMLRLKEKSIPFSEFLNKIQCELPVRASGIAVFMTGDPEGTPPALLHNLKHNRVLHQRNVLLTILTEDVPHIYQDSRVEIEQLNESFYRVSAFYGFMETPDICQIFDACNAKGINLPIEQITFFLGRETLIPTKRPGMAIWREYLFAFMSRNAERATSYFNIPVDQVVEIGIQVEL